MSGPTFSHDDEEFFFFFSFALPPFFRGGDLPSFCVISLLPQLRRTSPLTVLFFFFFFFFQYRTLIVDGEDGRSRSFVSRHETGAFLPPLFSFPSRSVTRIFRLREVTHFPCTPLHLLWSIFDTFSPLKTTSSPPPDKIVGPSPPLFQVRT